MRSTGKLDYLELPAAGRISHVKRFYESAFGWQFTDYGVQYSAFNEGLEGGFDNNEKKTAPLPVLYSSDLEKTMEAVTSAGGSIVKEIFSFPGGRRFHFADPAGNELAVWSET